MKKICYVITLPLTVKAFFVQQLKYLSQNGYDVSVICSYDKEMKNIFGKDVHYIPVEIPRGVSFFGTIVVIKKLLQIFKKEKFDLVQYSTLNASFCASIAATVCKVKIRNYHVMGFRYQAEKKVKRCLFKIIDKVPCLLSTSIECVSKSNMTEQVEAGFIDKNKTTVVWNGSSGGVNTERFCFASRKKWRTEIREKLGYRDNDFVFGFVGRITRDKGVNEMLEAFMSLSENAKLLIVGYNEGIDTLNKDLLKKAYSNPNIIFHDAVSDVERFYAAMDILVLPSYREGFGNVIIEAAAVGTPAIISKISGPTDAVLNGKTAIEVAPKSVSELKKAMKKIISREIILEPCVCAKFVKENFDEKELCKKILKRKKELFDDLDCK